MSGIDEEVAQACEYLSTMPNDEFEALWNPQPETESPKPKKSGTSEAQSWFEAFLDAILPS